jgi:formiminotetrahydrofolate cyclodeaminase
MNQQISSASVEFGDQSIREVVAQIADPAHHSGGGAIAAMTLAGAAAVVELVIRLAYDRPSQVQHREVIEPLLRETIEIRQRALTGADKDLAAFNRLLQAQQGVKDAREDNKMAAQESLQLAWLEAASAPAELAADALALIEVVKHALPFGTRFTVSDLGAGAALANGTIRAAILTVEANLSYVTGDRGSTLRLRCHQIQSAASEMASEIEGKSRERINRVRRKKTETNAQA